MAALGSSLTIFPTVPRSRTNTHRNLDAKVVRCSLFSWHTISRALRGLSYNPKAAFQMIRRIVWSNNRLRTKLKNLALIPIGLALADEVRGANLNHLHAYWLSGSSTVAFVASQVTGVSWSYSGHSWDIFVENNLIAEKTDAASFGRAISELARIGILRQAKGSIKPVHVIHLGVAIPDRPTKTNLDASPASIRLLCPAYLVPVKGHTYLLKALRETVDDGINCSCVFAGDGPLRNSLRREIMELRLERVVAMPGLIPHEELLRQVRSGVYDVVVLASVERGSEFEGIPVSLMEAMAAGIPCISTRTGAIGELIDDGCGILVNQRDPHAMSAAIKVLALDSLHRRQLGEKAACRIAKAFDSETSAKRLLGLMVSAQNQPS